MAERERPSGYSGTPLAKKLGIGAGASVLAIGAPAEYRKLLAPLPAGVKFVAPRWTPEKRPFADGSKPAISEAG